MTQKTQILISVVACCVIFFVMPACSVNYAKTHLLLAEKLWNDQNYVAALVEFEKVVAKDPHSALGQQALFRAATTQSLFLHQYGSALQKFQKVAQFSQDPKLVWEAKVQIGEILFSKLEQYDQAIEHYDALLRADPQMSKADEFLFRIGKSYYFLFHFKEALSHFQTLLQRYPKSSYVEKAHYEIAITYLTQGGEGISLAKKQFEEFNQRFPKSLLASQSKFGIANCLEDLDQFEDAYRVYDEIKDVYPDKKVIEIKLNRLKKRIRQRHMIHE